jgi:hypothetical protein
MNVFLLKRAIAVAITLFAVPVVVEGQQQPPAQQPAKRPARRQAAIEIRGVVPTPQVVTVRPREVPQYSRVVLVPNYYDHDFWQSLLPAYQFVPQRMITGSGVPRDTTRVPAAGTSTPAVKPAAADTSKTPGTAPATPPR